MENRQITNCNQCPNHCPAEALRCGRGRHYFEQLENKGTEETDGRESYGHGEHHGHGGTHSHGGGHGHGHGKPDDLYGLMRMCGHYLHHSEDREDKNSYFDGLNEAEQERLKELLKKLADSWEQ